MIGMYKTDRQVKILLDGFVDFHRSFCNKEVFFKLFKKYEI